MTTYEKLNAIAYNYMVFSIFIWVMYSMPRKLVYIDPIKFYFTVLNILKTNELI